MKHRLIPLLLGALLGLPAAAGPGHDHDHDAAPAARPGDAPQRLPDGTVFLPKPAQRQMALRTLPVAAAALPRSQTLQGLVVMDPDAGGMVQATQGGRLHAPPGGLPGLGLKPQAFVDAFVYRMNLDQIPPDIQTLDVRVEDGRLIIEGKKS